MRSMFVALVALFALACGEGGSEGARPLGGGTAGQQAQPAGGSAGAGVGGASSSGGMTSAGASNVGAGSGGTSALAGAGMGGSAPLGGGGSGPIVPVDPPPQRVVVYLPSWRGALSTWAPKLDASRMTYLNLCFADVDAAGNVSYSDAGLDAFVASAHAAGIKVCMAIGGASVIENGGVYATILQDGMRSGFVDKLMRSTTNSIASTSTSKATA